MLSWVTTAIAFLSLSVSVATTVSRPTKLTRSLQTADSARPDIEGREEDKRLAPDIPSGNSGARSHGHD